MKRTIFYISGFDPRGSRFYYQQFKNELPEWEKITNDKAEITSRKKDAEYVTKWEINNNDVRLDYHFLHWDDIVRQHWLRNPFKIFKKMIITYLGFFFNIDWKFIKTLPHQGPAKVFKNQFFLLLSFFLGIITVPLFAPYRVTFIIYAIIISLLYFLARKRSLFWLVRLYMFHYEMFTDNYKNIDNRLDIWADHVRQTLAQSGQEEDEIWLVGHSHGSVFAPLLMEKLCRNNIVPTNNITLITLGNLNQLNTIFRNMKDSHEAMKQLSNYNFEWLDISSPADGACFALSDPFLPIISNHKANIHLRSPRFHKTYSDEIYRNLKKDKYELHFSYLRCGERLQDNSFFQASLSPTTLKERFML